MAGGTGDLISYALKSHEGRLVIQGSDGHQVPWTCYGVSSELSVENWQRKQATFLKAGSHVFQICVWPGKNNYWDHPFYSLDGQPVTEPREGVTLSEQAEWLLSQDKDAHFIVRFGITPDPLWRKAHIDQYTPTPAHMGGDGFSHNPSMASDAYIKSLNRLLHDVVAWCENKPWRNRIIAYAVFPYGEGVSELACHGHLFDTCLPMQLAFKTFLARKYQTDQALRDAWQEQSASLATASVPTDEEWDNKKAALKLMHWPDPKLVQRERDYFELNKELYHRYCNTLFDAMLAATSARPCLKGYDILKQHMQGWLHNPCFDGAWTKDSLDTYSASIFACGAFDTEKLFDHPGLDMLQTPGMYYNRAMGFAWDAEGVTDSLTLRGKLNYMEADMRTWVNLDVMGNTQQNPVYDCSCFMTPEEMRAGFDRTLAWALSRNQMFYFMSVFAGNWWFDDPIIAEKIAAMTKVIERSLKLPWKETCDAICLVVDDASSMDEDFSGGLQYISMRRQTEEGLALCGVPYRVHQIKDLARGNFPNYKCYLFPDLYRITPETEKLLKQKVLRDGNVAIFGPGTGIAGSGNGLTAEVASRLLGVKMELFDKRVPRRAMLQDHGHPISRKLPNLTFGSDHAFGPVLAPSAQRFCHSREKAISLGNIFYHFFFDRPGLFVNELGKGARGEAKAQRGEGDCAVVFSAAVPLPPELLRECARHAGCNIWSEENAVVYACDSFVGLHTARSGKHTINLPRAADLIDLNTGECVAKQAKSVTVEVKAPATVLYEIK